jgi:citronellyl-CoA synthetase
MTMIESGKTDTAPADRITLSQVMSQLPWVARKLPSLLKGYYYFALLKPQKALTMADIVATNAVKYARRPAILYQDRSISYEHLNTWANRFANYFQSCGLTRGDVVAINLENRPELFAALIGANKVGAAAAMINTSQRGHVLAHSLNLVSPKLFVVGEEQVEAFESARADINGLTSSNVLFLADTDTRQQIGQAPANMVNLAEAIRNVPGTNPVLATPNMAGDIAVYLFTSGTTGLPKAAPSSHQKWFKAYGGFGHISLGLTPDDVLYVTLPFYHGTALLVCWGAALAGGSAIAVRRKFSASEFWNDVRRYNATCFGYVGELCRYLLAQPERPNDRSHLLRKMVGNGLRPSIWKKFKNRFGIEQIAELYGASEGNVGFSNFLNLENTVGFSTAPFALVKFHDGTREPVRNAKGFLQKVKNGEPGLLLGKITPKWNFEGYSQKEATEKAILRNAFRKGDAWFNTGDALRNIGCRHLQFVDRMGDTYRWKGENVSTTEVENVFDCFDGIDETIVYGVDVPHTNGKAGMATVVRTDPEQELDTERLLTYLRIQLPLYAIPLFLRVTDVIEKTGTFKYRKVDLKKTGYALDKATDQVLVWLPGTAGYQPLTAGLISEIEAGVYRF